jgi:AcrR family transcriptional regulator
MAETLPELSRIERRKARTRAALIDAAQRLFAQQGATDMSIQEITEAADVGFGTFYNHFASKAELFDAAIAEAFEEHGAWLDELLADEDDPAVVFATSMRLTGRLLKTHPDMAQVMMHATGQLLRSDRGLAPRALRDIRAAAAAGRFTVGDPEVALACAGGSLVAVLHLVSANPRAGVDRTTDEMVHNVLRMFGMNDRDATGIVSRPLPKAARAGARRR